MRLQKKELKKYYDSKARHIDELTATYKNKNLYKNFFYKTRFSNVIKALQPKKGEKILDIGCGIGFYANYIAKTGAKTYGIDMSSEYIKQAKKYAKFKINFKVADANKLPFKNGFFDKVLMTEVLEHIPDYKKALTQLCRVLRKGGKAVITTPQKNSYMNISYSVKRSLKHYAFNEHVIELDRNSFFSLLSKFFLVENIIYANYFAPFPLDEIFVKFPMLTFLVKKLDFLLSKTPIVNKMGWTMIATVRKV